MSFKIKLHLIFNKVSVKSEDATSIDLLLPHTSCFRAKHSDHYNWNGKITATKIIKL